MGEENLFLGDDTISHRTEEPEVEGHLATSPEEVALGPEGLATDPEDVVLGPEDLAI